MKVKIKRPSEDTYPEFTPNNVYTVIGIEANDYRIINDFGRPYLYPASIFDVVDGSPGLNWQYQHGDDGETYAYPPELGKPGFFEDLFDDKPGCYSALADYLSKKQYVLCVVTKGMFSDECVVGISTVNGLHHFVVDRKCVNLVNAIFDDLGSNPKKGFLKVNVYTTTDGMNNIVLPTCYSDVVSVEKSELIIK